jgi:hypothetical protein
LFTPVQPWGILLFQKMRGWIRPQVTGAAPRHGAGEPPQTRPEHANDALADEVLFEKLGSVPKQPAVDPADFDKFFGQVGCTKYGLSPPFQLHALAAAWVALDIPLDHCLRTIEAYLAARNGSAPDQAQCYHVRTAPESGCVALGSALHFLPFGTKFLGSIQAHAISRCTHSCLLVRLFRDQLMHPTMCNHGVR